MNRLLNINAVPQYYYSSYKQFEKEEKHVTRYCDEDVLIIMLDGTLRFSENGTPIELTKGEYYIQRRGLYQEGLKPSDLAYYYYVHFEGDWTDIVGIPVRGNYPAELLRLVETMDFLNSKGANIIEKAIVFLQMITILGKLNYSEPKTALAHKTEELLRTNLKAGINIEQIALQLNYSKNYIIQTFKAVYHTTPHEYLNQLRLEAAILRLKYSYLTLGEIAEECGFGNYINFYKAYKKAYGKSPRHKQEVL